MESNQCQYSQDVPMLIRANLKNVTVHTAGGIDNYRMKSNT